MHYCKTAKQFHDIQTSLKKIDRSHNRNKATCGFDIFDDLEHEPIRTRILSPIPQGGKLPPVWEEIVYMHVDASLIPCDRGYDKTERVFVLVPEEEIRNALTLYTEKEKNLGGYGTVGYISLVIDPKGAVVVNQKQDRFLPIFHFDNHIELKRR